MAGFTIAHGSARLILRPLCSAFLLAACTTGVAPSKLATRDAAAGNGATDAGLDPMLAPPDAGAGDAASPVGDTGVRTDKPIVIVMIGDGMGRGQLEAASLYAAGARDKLFMHGLPYRGEITTGGPSGITDSSAAATVMATGEYTYNSQVGIDREGKDRETLIELAHARGLVTGVVSTASLPHATPASFSAHDPSRHHYVAIADDQIMQVKPHVMLGGGARYFFQDDPSSARNDQGLNELIAQAGYQIVRDAAGLSLRSPAAGARIFGAFASDHMTYVRERGADTSEPTLREMSLRPSTPWTCIQRASS